MRRRPRSKPGGLALNCVSSRLPPRDATGREKTRFPQLIPKKRRKKFFVVLWEANQRAIYSAPPSTQLGKVAKARAINSSPGPSRGVCYYEQAMRLIPARPKVPVINEYLSTLVEMSGTRVVVALAFGAPPAKTGRVWTTAAPLLVLPSVQDSGHAPLSKYWSPHASGPRVLLITALRRCAVWPLDPSCRLTATSRPPFASGESAIRKAHSASSLQDSQGRRGGEETVVLLARPGHSAGFP